MCAHAVFYLPIENVEEPIESEERDIMRGEVLNDTHLVEHYDLWYKRYCLKPQGEAPRELPGGPSSI